MYRVIRYTFFVLACLGVVIIRRKKNLRLSATVVLFFGCVLLCSLLNLWPVENVFYSFQSPTDVFSYMHREEPLFSIEGKESALVVAKDETDAIIFEIVPNKKSGWKLPNISSSKKIVRGFYGGTHVQILRCSNEDYYVLVIANDINSVEDNKGSRFYYEKHQVGNKSVTSGYTYVNDLSGYSLFLDGKEVKIL